MRYIQASGTAFIRHVSEFEPTVFDENHNCRPRDLTPAEITAFGIHTLKLRTPPFHNPLTQTRTDGPAVLVDGVWTQNWVITAIPAKEAAEVLVAAKAAFILQVDTDADKLIDDVIGNRASEYERAEKEATAYKASGYPATPVPSTVSSWATAKGWTSTQAADSIIAAATGWRTAQASLRASRLGLKESSKTAITAEALDTIKASWAAFLVELKTQLV